MSARFRDKPMTPMETAIYWVEYVARYGGAPHLRSGGQNLNWIAYHNLDVFLFFLLVFLFKFYWMKRLLNFIYTNPSFDVKIKKD